MDKRTLIAGFIVLAIGIAIGVIADPVISQHPFNASFGLQ
jgi:hypothetical protein